MMIEKLEEQLDYQKENNNEITLRMKCFFMLFHSF